MDARQALNVINDDSRQVNAQEAQAYREFTKSLTGTVVLKRFDGTTTGAPSIYGEKKHKHYLADVTLNAVVRENPDAKTLTDIGIEQKVDLIVTLMRTQLTANSITDVSVNDLVVYKSVSYSIVRIDNSGDTIKNRKLLVQLFVAVAPGVV